MTNVTKSGSYIRIERTPGVGDVDRQEGAADLLCLLNIGKRMKECPSVTYHFDDELGRDMFVLLVEQRTPGISLKPLIQGKGE